MTDAQIEIPGYDVPAVEAWMAENVAGRRGPFTWVRCEGGHSNLTYELIDADGLRAVIRRPPQGTLLPKAHDMAREFRIIDALWPTPVPVAEPLGFCDDHDVIGADFFVMGFVEGRALFTRTHAEEWLPEENRHRAGIELAEAMAALHAVDVDEVGLGDLSRRDGYVARQIRSWYGSWTASIEAAQVDDPRLHELHDRLVERIPEQGPPCLVHGDLGPHNAMFTADGELTAIVDWEISTLGDPLADLAYLLNAWAAPDDVPPPTSTATSLAPGFPRREVLADRYAELTGRDLSGLGFYTAYNHFKTACIIHGVYARYMLGQKAIGEQELADLRHRLGECIERAVAAGDLLT